MAKAKKLRESKIPEFIDFQRYFRFFNPENSSYDFGLKLLIAEKRITSELAARYQPEEADADGRYLFFTWEPLFELVFIY